MSGGYFNYFDGNLKTEIFGWTDRPHNVFEDREISELVWDVLDLIHEYDWYKSGDNREETYLKAKAEFKKKWFSNRGVRIRSIVDDAIADCKAELYKTFGFEEGGARMPEIRPAVEGKKKVVGKYSYEERKTE